MITKLILGLGLLTSTVAVGAENQVYELVGTKRHFLCTAYGYTSGAHHVYLTVYGDILDTQALAEKSALFACAKHGLSACQTTCFIK